MTTCCNCGVLFDSGRDKSYRCPPCKSAYNKQHYENNKASYISRAAANRAKMVISLNTRLIEYFASHPCVDCGEPDPVVPEFDHIADKSSDVARMVTNGFSWKSISKEIAKCEVRCANCHRRITAKRGGWMRYRLNE